METAILKLFVNLTNQSTQLQLLSWSATFLSWIAPAVPTAIVAWLGYKYAEKNTKLQIEESRKDRITEHELSKRDEKIMAYRENTKILFRVFEDQFQQYIDYSINRPDNLDFQSNEYEKYLLKGIALTSHNSFNIALSDLLTIIDISNNYEKIIGLDVANISYFIQKVNIVLIDYLKGEITLKEFSNAYCIYYDEIKKIKVSVGNALNGYIHRPENEDSSDVQNKVNTAEFRVPLFEKSQKIK